MVSTKSPTPPRIILVGSNPSIATQSDFAFFLDTKSGRTLRQWVFDLESKFQFIYCNVSNITTDKNRPLTRQEIKDSLPTLYDTICVQEPIGIVALGKTASYALTLLGCAFLDMPHPSPKNRVLNDKEKLKNKISAMKEYIENKSHETELICCPILSL